MVVNGLKFSFSTWLNSIHKADSSRVLMVVWIIRHAKVVGTSPMLCGSKASSTPSCIHQLSSSSCIWAAGFSPPCVYHSTLPWIKGTWYSLLSLLSLRSTGTWHSIFFHTSSQHLNVGPRVFVLHYVWMHFSLCGLMECQIMTIMGIVGPNTIDKCITSKNRLDCKEYSCFFLKSHTKLLYYN